MYPKTTAGPAAVWLAGKAVYLRGDLDTSKKNGNRRTTVMKFWYPVEAGLTLLSEWVGL